MESRGLLAAWGTHLFPRRESGPFKKGPLTCAVSRSGRPHPNRRPSPWQGVSDLEEPPWSFSPEKQSRGAHRRLGGKHLENGWRILGERTRDALVSGLLPRPGTSRKDGLPFHVACHEDGTTQLPATRDRPVVRAAGVGMMLPAPSPRQTESSVSSVTSSPIRPGFCLFR